MHFTLAVDEYVYGFVRRKFVSVAEVFDERLDAYRRVSRGVPIGRMLAIIEEVLY